MGSANLSKAFGSQEVIGALDFDTASLRCFLVGAALRFEEDSLPEILSRPGLAFQAHGSSKTMRF